MEFDTWLNVLRRVPGSVLWLLRLPPDGEAGLLREAAARGLAPGRVVFGDAKPHAEHLKRTALADLFLDSMHCTGKK